MRREKGKEELERETSPFVLDEDNDEAPRLVIAPEICLSDGRRRRNRARDMLSRVSLPAFVILHPRNSFLHPSTCRKEKKPRQKAIKRPSTPREKKASENRKHDLNKRFLPSTN
jgi:hypothetical protein